MSCARIFGRWAGARSDAYKEVRERFVATAYERDKPEDWSQLPRCRSPKLAALATFAGPPALLHPLRGPWLSMHGVADLDDRRPHDHDEQTGQEENDHGHGELGRQRGR